jgi:hypothetical protein
VDLEILRKILKIGGLGPDKLTILSYEFETLHRIYRMYQIGERLTQPKGKLAKRCNEVSVAASKLLELLYEYADLRMFFKEFLQIDIEKAEELVGNLARVARNLYEILSGEDDQSDEGHHRPKSENLSLEAVVAASLISKSMVTSRGRKESPKTFLFVRVRELFIRLGGTSDIGSGGPLYRFTKACSEVIDGEIRMPEPEPFRILMMAALKRRVADTL